MTARWPLELPQYPLREGLDVEPLDTDVRGETDSGPGTVRAAELGEWNKVRCTVALRSREERDRLLQWHRDDLVGGTQEFDWPELDASVGDLSYRYMFTAKPKRVPRGVQGWRMALELMTLPAPPPVGLVRDGALGDYIATVTRPAPVTYYAADLSKQTAAVDASAIDYDPVGGRRRGQRLNSGDFIDCSLVALDEEGGTLRYTEEPMTTADRTVHEARDESGSSAVRLAVENGRYVFTVVNAGTVVAALDTGVAPAIFQRKQIVCAYSRDRIIAVASGGEPVVAAGGNIPPVDTLTRWRVGGSAATPGQCWVVDFDYIGRAEQRPAAGAVDVIRDALVLAGNHYLSPYVQITRNTEATYVDANGVLQTVGIDEPVLEYLPESGELWLRKEQSATNYCRHSNDQFSWSGTYVSVAEADPAPTGERMFTVSETGGNGRNVMNVNFPAGNICIELLLKASPNTTAFGLKVESAEGNFFVDWDIDPESGASFYGQTPSSLQVARVIDLGGGYFRAAFSYLRSTSGAGQFWVAAYRSGGELSVGSVNITNAQNPSSPIITTDAARTRAADDIRITDLTPFNGFTEGAFVVVYETQSAPSSLDNRILSRGANGRLLSLRGAQGAYTYDGSSVEILGGGVSAGSHVYAVAFGDGSQAMCINGGAVKEEGWNETWGAGDAIIGELNWSGWLKLRFIPRRPTNTELPEVTS